MSLLTIYADVSFEGGSWSVGPSSPVVEPPPAPPAPPVPEDAQSLLDQFRAANDALTAKIAGLEARTVISTEQLAAFQAELKRAIDLGK